MNIRLYNKDNTVTRYNIENEIKVNSSILTYNHNLYFSLENSHTIIRIENLVITRARPSGIVNAIEKMERASRGTNAKRAPICVIPHGNDDYLVLDGNSTVIVAVAAAWVDIPCVIDKTQSRA